VQFKVQILSEFLSQNNTVTHSEPSDFIATISLVTFNFPKNCPHKKKPSANILISIEEGITMPNTSTTTQCTNRKVSEFVSDWS